MSSPNLREPSVREQEPLAASPCERSRMSAWTSETMTGWWNRCWTEGSLRICVLSFAGMR